MSIASILSTSAIENCYVKNVFAKLKPRSEIWAKLTETIARCALRCSHTEGCVSFRYVSPEHMCFAYDYRVRRTRKSSNKTSFHVLCKDEGYILGTGAQLYFKFHQEEADWTMALEVCRSEGAGLIVLDTNRKHKFITSKLRSLMSGPFRVWTALRRAKIRKYMWPNGKDKVFGWNKGDPSYTNEHCCFLKPTGLADAHGTDKHEFICEKKTSYFQ